MGDGGRYSEISVGVCGELGICIGDRVAGVWVRVYGWYKTGCWWWW